jgi:fucose permease
VPAFRLSCLAYFSVALPASTLGLLWPSIRLSFHQPVAVLGLLLVFGVTATVIASAVTGRLLPRLPVGRLLATGTALTAAALLAEAEAPAVWMFACGMVAFGLGFGVIDAAVNVHAAHRFSARQINWMHAGYGAGATIGPVLAAVLLGNGLGWQWVYGILGGSQAALAVVFSLTGRAWAAPRPAPAASPTPPASAPPVAPAPVARRPGSRRRPVLAALGALTFTAVENGIESGAGLWGYAFLTQGRGLTDATAGAALSAYWAMMFLGRIVLGAVAERVGAARVLGAAVAVVSVGCALMAVPGPGLLAVAGLLVVGLAAAPVFPLFTLTTARRVGAGGATRMVSLQVAASAVGSAAVPAVIGLAIGAFTANALAPQLLALSVAMYALYRLLGSGRPGRLPTPPASGGPGGEARPRCATARRREPDAGATP